MSTFAFSFAGSAATRPKTSSHLLRDAASTAFQSHVGISASAFAQACAALLKDTPKRARTEDALKESSAPAWMGETLGWKGKAREVLLEVILMVLGLLVDAERYVPNSVSRVVLPGALKS